MKIVVVVLLMLLGACTTAPPRLPPPVVDGSGQAQTPPPDEAAPVIIEAPAQTTSTHGAVVALLDRADAYQRSGDSAKEAAIIERALRIDPQDARLWSRLAAARLAQGQARQAEQLALKSNALAGGDRRLQAHNWGLVAQARWALNDSAGARNAESRARELQ